jgi:hypothetical protein
MLCTGHEELKQPIKSPIGLNNRLQWETAREGKKEESSFVKGQLTCHACVDEQIVRKP